MPNDIIVLIAIVSLCAIVFEVRCEARAKTALGRTASTFLGIFWVAVFGLTLWDFMPYAFGADARHICYDAFYRDIHLGMTRDDVYSCMNKHYPEGGKRGKPSVFCENEKDRLGFFMNPEGANPNPNGEGILLIFKWNRVIWARYSPD